MKYLHTLIVFLLTASLYAQTPTTVLEGITNLNAPMAIHGHDLYYVSDNDHVYKIDLTEANPTPQAVVSTLTQNYDSYSIFDLAFQGNTLYLSVPNIIGDHSLTDILKVDLTANTLTSERVIAFTVPSSPIAIMGNDLYMAISGLIKLDLTVENPTPEVVMASLPEDHTSETFSDYIFDGNILYMASRGESNNTGVFKVDVAAENPVYEKIVESGDVVGIALNGNSLYYDRGANKIQRIQDVNGGTLQGANLVTSGIDTMGQLAVHNNHLYIADQGANKILKYPLSPFEAIYELGQPMAVHGDDLYYVSDEDHIYKIDLTAENPATEAVVSFSIEEPHNYTPTSLAFHGDMLYVSEFNNITGDKISRVDLTTDPPNIEEIYDLNTFPKTPITFLGNYIYFVNPEGNDGQYQLLRLDVTAQTPTAEVVLTLPSGANAMAFHGNDLYIAPDSNNDSSYRLDVTAETPVIEKLPGLDSGIRGFVFDDNRLYYSVSNTIRVIPDVVSSESFEGVDVISEGLGSPYGLAIHNNHLYIADTDLDEIVIHHPLLPYIMIDNLEGPMAFHGDDLYYASGYDHIHKIIDVTAANPVTEEVVSLNFPVGEEQDHAVIDLAFHGDMLYVSEFNNMTGDKISRVDITANPPQREEIYQLNAVPKTSISFFGDHIYFADRTNDGQHQLLRLDVTAQTPTAEVVLMLPSAVDDMAFHGNDLYLISSSGLDYRVDVNAETPVLEELPSNLDSVTRDIVFQGNRLYHATPNAIRVVQSVNSETFEVVDLTIEGLGNPHGLAIHNNLLYIADTGTGEIVIHDLALSATIWEGDDLTFTKASGADWTQEANQDRITDDVWITRQNSKPIYNYKWWQDTFNTDVSQNDLQFEFFDGNQGPDSPILSFTATGGTKGLRWAILDDTGATTNNWEGFSMYGTLGNPAHFYSFNNVVTMIDQLEQQEEVTIHSVIDNFRVRKSNAEGTSNVFKPFDFGNIVGKKLGVWIEDENIYMTLTFNSWDFGEGEGSGDGGFSYTRSTDSSLSSDTPETSSQIILAPNPVRDRMYVYGLNKPSSYRIYNLLGVEVSQGWLSDGGAVEVKPLPKGLYLLKLQNGSAIKFVKE